MRYSSTREADASTAQFGKLSEKGATASQTNPKDPPDNDDACNRACMYMYLILDEKSRPAGMCKPRKASIMKYRIVPRIYLTTEAHFK